MRQMQDAADWTVLPRDGSPVAAYINARYRGVDWAVFGDAPRLPILTYIPDPFEFDGVQWQTVDGAWWAQWSANECRGIIAAGGYIALDVEAGDAPRAAGFTVVWCDGIRAAGFKPVVYTSAGSQHHIAAATTDWWLAGGDGHSPFLFPGTVATQYAWPPSTGSDVDLNMVVDYFPSGPAGTVQAPVAVQGNVPPGMLGLGSTGDGVKALQTSLNGLDGAGLTVDGDFGPATQTAVVDFQNRNGLAADGLVGPATQGAIDHLTAAPAASALPVQEPAPPAPVADEGVRRLQQELNKVDGAGIPEDGLNGPATEGAVKDFQGRHGLAQDGIVGPQTEAALAEALNPLPAFPGTVQRGSQGDAVRAVQARLAARGWTISVDGDFGPGTEAIVREFQSQKGLTADGVAGPDTWRALWADPITGN